MYRIVNQLKVETDAEARTWGVAALLKNADDRGVDAVCREAGLEAEKSLMLAARLYAPDDWLSKHYRPVKVFLRDDDLTLKWAIFLAGYGKASPEMFDPSHANEVFLGELNQHGTPEICEYSVWALWQRRDLGPSHVTVALDQIMKCPENARKWLYRLYLICPLENGLDADAFTTMRKAETSAAREGLALGVADFADRHFDSAILDWYEDELDEAIKETLLIGMAGHSSSNGDFADLVRQRFPNLPANSTSRARLLAATAGSELFSELRRIEYQLDLAQQGALFGGSGPIIFNKVEGDVVMSSKISAGRDINAQNVAGGDVFATANTAVQRLATDRSSEKALLTQVLDYASSGSVSPDEASLISNRVKAVAEEPTNANRIGLLETLKTVAEGTAAVGTAGAGLAGLIEAVAHLF